MNEMTFTHEGKTFKRITRRAAEKAFKDGIWLCPCNMRPFGGWGVAVFVNSGDFNKVVNEFEFYNCNSETGRYISFYKEIDETR